MKNSKRDKDQNTQSQINRRGFLGTGVVAASAGVSLASTLDKVFMGNAIYLDQKSYSPNDTIRFHISSHTKNIDISISRVGAKREEVWSRKGIATQSYQIPHDASSHGCRWPVGLELKIPESWKSGYYEIQTNPEMQRGYVAYFIVRPQHPGSNSKILLQMSTNTDNAYNNWGGYSVYAYNGRNGVQGHRVSTQRPSSAGPLRKWEVPFIRWAESNGYNLDYIVNNDLEFHPEIINQYQLVLSVGHDEYWSSAMRDTVENFVAKGGNAAFFSGNVSCWQIRNEEKGAAFVCYKQNFRKDPLFNSEGPNPNLTTLWSHHLIGRPENKMTGVGVLFGGFHRSHGQYMDGTGAHTVHRADHWVFEKTGVKAGDEYGGKQTIVGYECDGCEYELKNGVPVPTGRDGTPRNFEILATCPAKWGPEETLSWYDRWPKNQQGASCMGVHSVPGGGTVFTAGTTDWSHGLAGKEDRVVAQVTRNVLDRLTKS